MYDNLGIRENIWCDILGFDQSEQMNIKLMLHSVWKFWQIAINSIAKKSLICHVIWSKIDDLNHLKTKVKLLHWKEKCHKMF